VNNSTQNSSKGVGLFLVDVEVVKIKSLSYLGRFSSPFEMVIPLEEGSPSSTPSWDAGGSVASHNHFSGVVGFDSTDLCEDSPLDMFDNNDRPFLGYRHYTKLPHFLSNKRKGHYFDLPADDYKCVYFVNEYKLKTRN